MTWLVFSYSLPSKAQSSPRVALWRRLRRLGAISPTGGIHLLPARKECLEAFQWLAEEVKQAKGDALVMYVEKCEGLSHRDLMERFRQARAEDYAELEAQADELEQSLRARLNPEERSRLQEALHKLQKRHADIARVDFFDAPEGSLVASELARLAHALAPPGGHASKSVVRTAGGLSRYPLGDAPTPARGSPLVYLAYPTVQQPTGGGPLLSHPGAGRGRL
jgi:hypothetical protein